MHVGLVCRHTQISMDHEIYQPLLNDGRDQVRHDEQTRQQRVIHDRSVIQGYTMVLAADIEVLKGSGELCLCDGPRREEPGGCWVGSRVVDAGILQDDRGIEACEGLPF